MDSPLRHRSPNATAAPRLATEFISVEAWIHHYVAGACPTSLSAAPRLAAEFISVEAWIHHYVADQITL